MPVDEKALGKWILARAGHLLPLSFILLGGFMLAGNQGMMLIISILLAAWYHRAGLDGRLLVGYGVLALLLAVPWMQGQADFAESLELAGYYLCVAGGLRLASGMFLGKDA
jgi:hypothetical protein